MARIKTLGVIGDIHAEDRLLEEAIRELTGRGVEKIVATGDIVDGVGDVERCCALLAEHRIDTVRGNHDRWLTRGTMRDLPHSHLAHQLTPRTQDFLRLLLPTMSYETAAGRLLLCHGIGADDMSTVMPHTRDQDLVWLDPLQKIIGDREVDVLVAGHSHRAMSRRVGGLWLINGGTLCSDQSPCCVVVQLAEGKAEILPLAVSDPGLRWTEMILARLALFALACALVPACSPSQPAQDPAAGQRSALHPFVGSWQHSPSEELSGKVSMLVDEGGAFSWLAEPRGGVMCRFAGRVSVEPGGDALGYLSIVLSIDTCREKLVYRSFKIISLSGDSMILSEDRETGGDGKPMAFRRVGPPPGGR